LNARIEEAKKPEKEIVSRNREIDNTMRDLSSYAARGDAAKAAETARKLAEQMQAQSAAGRTYAANVKDAARKKEIEEACDTLDRLLAEIAKQTKVVLENPHDKAAQKKLDDLMAQARAAGAKLAVAMIEDQLSANREGLNASLANLYQAAKRGDTKEATEALKDITDAIQRRIELG
jgi:hypothetical protein